MRSKRSSKINNVYWSIFCAIKTLSIGKHFFRVGGGVKEYDGNLYSIYILQEAMWSINRHKYESFTYYIVCLQLNRVSISTSEHIQYYHV